MIVAGVAAAAAAAASTSDTGCSTLGETTLRLVLVLIPAAAVAASIGEDSLLPCELVCVVCFDEVLPLLPLVAAVAFVVVCLGGNGDSAALLTFRT